MSTPPKNSPWSLELVITIALPVSAVVAGLITLWIASSHGYTPSAVELDRFARDVVAQDGAPP